jgi:hypothetical protein
MVSQREAKRLKEDALEARKSRTATVGAHCQLSDFQIKGC